MSIDSVGNFLTIIRNSVAVSKSFVIAPYSKLNFSIAQIFRNEGFIKDVQVVAAEVEYKKTLKLYLKYVDGESVIHEITRISKPSRRIHVKVKNIKPVVGGLGISILSTNKGLITDKQAKMESVFAGGEIICRIW